MTSYSDLTYEANPISGDIVAAGTPWVVGDNPVDDDESIQSSPPEFADGHQEVIFGRLNYSLCHMGPDIRAPSRHIWI